MSSSTNTINPKPCNYGCNTTIYWNTSENAYFEVFSGNRHQCPNRQQDSNYNKKAASSYSSPPPHTSANKPSYYSTTTNNNKKSWSTTTTIPKPKMSNSLELLQGPIADVQKKYEILSDIISAANGKVHGSQSHIVTTTNNSISLIVYYEVPEGQRDEIKHKFSSHVKNLMVYNNH